MTRDTDGGRYAARDARAIIEAAGTRQRERRLIDALLRRMTRLEAALKRHPGPGPERDRLGREVLRLRQDVARARAAFARRPLGGTGEWEGQPVAA